MPVQVVMPQLGESVDEGTISKWLIEEGQAIRELEPLVEVNTDKVDTEIPSPAAGTLLKILAQPGTVARKGTVLAWIGQPGEAVPEGEGMIDDSSEQPEESESPGAVQPERIDLPPVQPETAAGLETPTSPGRHPRLGFISPVVARLAQEFKLDLSRITGSGAGGRITKKDVLNFLEREPVTPSMEPERQPVHSTAEPASSSAGPRSPQIREGALLPLDQMRRMIAEHMVMSKRTSPHVTTVMEVDLGRVSAHREANKSNFARDNVRLTFTAYFVAATISALRAFPLVNSSWTEEGIRLHGEINIGIAASLGEAGLIVPVIRNADGLSLLGIARAVNDLAERARNRQLKPDDVRGGTFTITNHGTAGSLFATPIINQPQCGILGVGAIQKRVVVLSGSSGDTIAIRPMAYLSLTFDHRILDGAAGDGFLGKVVESLQTWT